MHFSFLVACPYVIQSKIKTILSLGPLSLLQKLQLFLCRRSRRKDYTRLSSKRLRATLNAAYSHYVLIVFLRRVLFFLQNESSTVITKCNNWGITKRRWRREWIGVQRPIHQSDEVSYCSDSDEDDSPLSKINSYFTGRDKVTKNLTITEWGVKCKYSHRRCGYS